MLRVTLFKSSFSKSKVILSGCVIFCCYVGVVDDAWSEAVVFQRAVFFFLQLHLFSVEGVLLVSRIFLLCFLSMVCRLSVQL